MISKGSVAWGPDWMPITPKRGSLFHADLHRAYMRCEPESGWTDHSYRQPCGCGSWKQSVFADLYQRPLFLTDVRPAAVAD